MRYPTSIETERLNLRFWREDDLTPLAAMCADPRVMEFFPSLMTLEETRAMLLRIQQHFELHGFGFWAVELKNGGPFIGMLGLSTPRFTAHFTPCIEVGWRIAAGHWGNGYATEGGIAVMNFASKHVGLNEVVAMTAVGNQKSRRVMEKLGMTHSPSDDFDHPMIAPGHRLSRHVLYRRSFAYSPT